MSLINVPLMSSKEDLRRQLRSSSRAKEGSRLGMAMRDRDEASSHISSRHSEAHSIHTNLAGVPAYRQRRQSEPQRRRDPSRSSSSRHPAPPSPPLPPPPRSYDSVNTNDRVIPSPPSLVPSIRHRSRPISSATSTRAPSSLRTLRRTTHRVGQPFTGQVPNIHIVPPSTTGPARLRDRSPSRGSTRGPVIKHADEDARGMRTPSPSGLLPVAGAAARGRSSSKASSRMERSQSRPRSSQSSRARSSSSHRPSIRNASSRESLRAPSYRSSTSRHSRTHTRTRTPPPPPQFDPPSTRLPPQRFRGFVKRLPRAPKRFMKRQPLFPNGSHFVESVPVLAHRDPTPTRHDPSEARSIRSHHSRVQRSIPPPQPIPLPVLPLSRSRSRTRTPSPVAPPQRRLPTFPNWRVMETGRAGWARLRRGRGVQAVNTHAALLPVRDRPRRHSEETHRSGGSRSMRSMASQRSRSLPRIPVEERQSRSRSRSARGTPSPFPAVMGNVPLQPQRGRTASFGILRRLGNMGAATNGRWRRGGGAAGAGAMLNVASPRRGDEGRTSRSRSTTRRIPFPSSAAQQQQRFLTTQRSRSLPRIPPSLHSHSNSQSRRRHESLPSIPSSRPSPRHRTISLNIFTPFKKIGRVHVDYKGKLRKGREVDVKRRDGEVTMGNVARERDSPRPSWGWGALTFFRPPSLHPLLAPPTIFRPLRLTWDVRYPALPRKYVKDTYLRRSLEEPATNPPMRTFRLLIPVPIASSSRTFPPAASRLRNGSTIAYWSTLVHRTGPTPVTPLQILKSLAVMLRTPATPSEIARIPSSKKEEVERAYTKRVRAGEAMGQGTEERERRVGVRRVDLLGGKVMWGGVKWMGAVGAREEERREAEAQQERGGWVVQLGETWI